VQSNTETSEEIVKHEFHRSDFFGDTPVSGYMLENKRKRETSEKILGKRKRKLQLEETSAK